MKILCSTDKNVTYRAYFNLLEAILDDQFDDAVEYLEEDTDLLTDVLKRQLPEIADKIIQIRWVLRNLHRGYIELTTTAPLSEDQLSEVSRWVLGQNSDGIGESFEQYFAYTEPAPESSYYNEDYYEEDYYIMPSFDWERNKYPFEEIK